MGMCRSQPRSPCEVTADLLADAANPVVRSETNIVMNTILVEVAMGEQSTRNVSRRRKSMAKVGNTTPMRHDCRVRCMYKYPITTRKLLAEYTTVLNFIHGGLLSTAD